MMSSTVGIASVCLAQMVPFSIENPASSFFWDAPPVCWLARRHGVRYVRTDFCQWGVPWRKRTGIMLGLIDSTRLDRLCSCKAAISSRRE